MARRGWARSIFVATVAAAVAAAAQLGLGYGLGIIAWASPDVGAAGVTASGAWSASLAWATWVAATSVVIGAVIGDRFGGTVVSGTFVRASWRLVMALAATIGALVTVPLVAVPARGAEVADNYAPHILAGVFATVGVVLGLLIALIALISRAVAANVFASAVWLWLLAIVAVIDSVAAGRGLGYAQLGVWTFTGNGPIWRSFYIPGALLMLGAALLTGGLAAFPAAVRADGRAGVAVSGAFGPLIVATAYVLADPSQGAAPIELMSAFYTAPYMVIAGLAGSVLVAVVGGVPVRAPRRTRLPGATAARGLSKHDAASMLPAPPSAVPRQSATAAGPSAFSAKAAVPPSSRADPADDQFPLLGLGAHHTEAAPTSTAAESQSDLGRQGGR